MAWGHGTLQHCPTCQQKWPEKADHDLRSFRWLPDLPREISPSNLDAIFHDGYHGRDRFVVFETKREPEPLQTGQSSLLRALAGAGMTVRVLRGTLDRLHIERVTSTGVEPGLLTRPEAVRSSLIDFLNGQPWADPKRPVLAPRECPSCHRMHPPLTTCLWATR